MTREAKLADDGGLVPEGPGWFVVNLAEARWRTNDTYGTWCAFEGEHRFRDVGINVHVLQPDQPACRYHSEGVEEAFLVLSGECRLIVDGEERRLAAWDFFHCAPGTEHVFVGAGDGPCAVLMVGARGKDQGLRYPVNELAKRFGASVEAETTEPSEAYAGTPPSVPVPSPWPLGE